MVSTAQIPQDSNHERGWAVCKGLEWDWQSTSPTGTESANDLPDLEEKGHIPQWEAGYCVGANASGKDALYSWWLQYVRCLVFCVWESLVSSLWLSRLCGDQAGGLSEVSSVTCPHFLWISAGHCSNFSVAVMKSPDQKPHRRAKGFFSLYH